MTSSCAHSLATAVLSPNTLTIPLARSLCLVCCFLFLHVLVYTYVQTASTPYIFRCHVFSHPLLQLVYLHQLMEGKHQLHKLLKAQNSISTSCSRMQQQHTTCARAQPQTLPYPCTSCMLVLHPSIQCKLLHNTTASKAV